MNEFEIDQLFREKLSGRNVRPSEEAWTKISTGLKKGKDRRAWAWGSLAASVIFLIGIGMYLLKAEDDRSNRQNTVAELKKSDDRIARNEGQPAVPQVFEDAESGKQDERSQKKPGPKREEKAPLKITEEVVALSTPLQKGNAAPGLDTETKERTVEPGRKAKTPEDHEINIAEPESLAEQTVSQPLQEENSMLANNLPVATEPKQEEYPEIKIIYKSSEKSHEDKNTLQKVVALARDIKEGDIGLGTLREAKNELLAFGFKKSKHN